MNFQQLRILRETVRQDFNLTEVANALYTAQSGVSKHIKDLEDELGVEIFVRKGRKLLGLTPPGAAVLEHVEKLWLEVSNIKNIAAQYGAHDHGRLTIATTHTQARYKLPAKIAAFQQRYPNVNLCLLQGSPQEIQSQLLAGEADIGIATEALADVPELEAVPYYGWRHGLVVPANHALANITPDKLDLAMLCAHPMITYHAGFTGRAKIENAFTKAHLQPNIVLSALDADVIKTYVRVGLGVGIIAEMAFDPERDADLRCVSLAHLWSENTTMLAWRKGQFMRAFVRYFVELCLDTSA